MSKGIINRLKSVIHSLRKEEITNINVVSLRQNQLLQGRCALITGGTSGIGFSIAKSFIGAGATVVITGRDKEKIESSVKKLPDGRVIGFVWDITKVNEFEEKFLCLQKILKNKSFSQIDILVNNAGVNCKRMPYANEEEFDMVINTNLKGAFFLSQLVGKYFVENKIKGNILNIASASSIRPADSAYTVSKWGIRGLTLGLAKALGPKGITVNGIAPGPTATPMMIKEGQTNLTLTRIPLGRYIMPDEISSMSVVLVSELGRSIMGDIVYMTGGAGILTYDDVRYDF